MKKKVLLLGYKGMFGSDAISILENSGFRVFKADLPDTDITDLDSLNKTFLECNPDIVINGSAYTDVDGAETQRDLAMSVNRDGAFNVAKMCKKFNAFLVHISTDYVFNGTKKEGYIESDEIGRAVNFYGESKLQGELKIREVLKENEFLICRTQWLYGRGRRNFVKFISEVSKAKKEIEVIDDQWGVPTWTKDLAEQMVYLIKNEYFGVSHTVAGGGPITWFQLAEDIVKILKRECKIVPISSEKLKRPAKRFKYGFLKNKIIPQEIVRDYKISLELFFKEENLL